MTIQLNVIITLIVVNLNLILCKQSYWTYTSNDPDIGKSPCELIESRNFICEQHWITTRDGYILSAHRIINPIFQSKGIKPIKPYVLQHGLFGSSTHFLINSLGGHADDWTGSMVKANLSYEGRNLAYLLANYNYDVWLVNSRGNCFSKNHTHLNPKRDARFWKFSFDEMIAYDAPAMIDYILTETGSESLGWIGHSQGTLIMFGLLSEKPEYTNKVSPFIAMAPIAHVEHITSPIRYLTNIPGLMKLFHTIGGELSVPNILLDIVAEKVCGQTVIEEACGSLLFLVCGVDIPQMNFTRIPVYFSQSLGGTSTWDLLHFGQNIINKGFLKFDYGLLGNLAKYGQFKPPQYNLGSIKSESMILFSSNNDPLSDPKDLETLRKSLQVPFTEYIVTNPSFSHLDFIWAIDVYNSVYKPMMEIIKKFD